MIIVLTAVDVSARVNIMMGLMVEAIVVLVVVVGGGGGGEVYRSSSGRNYKELEFYVKLSVVRTRFNF